ncbi:hypothetical protein PP175_16340 [Aneurinibacillus sp. Ricciae_BoGa-3]|uniref:hypothetical protein n=1 Tax=Aneurinibacillus sp. Ricciae_BoGa-3 TaxID=3022697 RepID=UPI00233F99F8|nr:hypothetical protein [Aneurinibacillus sp. Ricciae_BoGa-3]WCK52981.1 hypothetical protein PP175_16340 [Aneurinibacillus sp. Ricciae_BoGa-3]
MGCCSIGAFKDFDVIVIGATPTGISVALHCISYGALTALVDKHNADDRLIRFFEGYQEPIKEDFAMVNSLDELKQDMDFVSYEGEAYLKTRTP